VARAGVVSVRFGFASRHPATCTFTLMMNAVCGFRDARGLEAENVTRGTIFVSASRPDSRHAGPYPLAWKMLDVLR